MTCKSYLEHSFVCRSSLASYWQAVFRAELQRFGVVIHRQRRCITRTRWSDEIFDRQAFDEAQHVKPNECGDSYEDNPQLRRNVGEIERLDGEPEATVRWEGWPELCPTLFCQGPADSVIRNYLTVFVLPNFIQATKSEFEFQMCALRWRENSLCNQVTSVPP